LQPLCKTLTKTCQRCGVVWKLFLTTHTEEGVRHEKVSNGCPGFRQECIECLK